MSSGGSRENRTPAFRLAACCLPCCALPQSKTEAGACRRAIKTAIFAARKMRGLLPSLPEMKIASCSFPLSARIGSFDSEPVELHEQIDGAGMTTASGVFRWLSNDPIGIAGGLNQYAFVGNNPVNAVDPLGLCNATRATNPQLQLIRAYIDATDIAAAVAWWVPKGGLLVGGAIALHGGPWAPLDLMTNAKVPTWTVDGQTMTSPQYGNYLAGYYAGYADSSGILFGMYYGGISWAIAGNAGAVFTGQPYGESVFDEQSVPYITAGFIAGSQDRDCQQQSCR